MVYFQPASRCLFFFQRWTPGNKKITQSFLSTAKFITKYSSERFFLYLPWENISEGLLKFCKLISNLILDQIIDSNLKQTCKNVPHKLCSTSWNYMLDITKTNIKYNNYSGLPFEIKFLKHIKEGHSCLRLLNPLTCWARWKTKTMPSEIGLPNFDKRRISQPKSQ